MDADVASPPRVDVLAYPTATTTRFLLVVLSLLTAGLFLGTWVHNTTPVGDTWTRTVSACVAERSDPSTGPDFADRQTQFTQCTGDVERLRAAFSAGGLLVGALAGVAILYVAPVVVRRRRGLVPPGPRLDRAAARFAELAEESGIRRTPALAIGNATVRDGFSFGRPGRYTVVLPRGVAIHLGKRDDFDPLIRHELSHVSSGDVPVAWISLSLLFALVPLLLLPVVLSPLLGDVSLLGDYAWRAALVAGVALLVSRATLRSREFDADVRAARHASGAAPLLALLTRARRPPSRRGWRSVAANHPDPAARARNLERPEGNVRVTFLDGVATAFLTAVSAPLLVSALTTVLAPVGATNVANALPYLLVGPMLGATLGLGIWRQSIVARVTGTPAPATPAALGVAVGLLLGQPASLANVGQGWQLEHPGWFVASALLGIGATFVVAGLGELWADAAPRFRRPRTSWVTAVVLSSVVFAFALWVSETMRQAFEGAGWLLVTGSLFALMNNALPAVLAAGLGLAVLWVLLAARDGGTAPSWLIVGSAESVPWPRPPRTLAVLLAGGLVSGVVATAVAVVHWATSDAPERPEDVFTYLAVAVAGAAASALAVTVLLPRRGPGLALLAAPTATLAAAPGLLAIGAESGGLTASLVEAFVRIPLGLAVVAVVFVACVAAFRTVALSDGVTAPLVVVASAGLAVLLSLWTVVGRNVLLPFADPGASATEQAEDIESDIEVLAYLDTVVSEYNERFVPAAEEADRLLTDPAPDPVTAATRLSEGPIADIAALADDLRDRQFRDEQVTALHEKLVAALDLDERALTAFADYLRTGDENSLSVGRDARAQADGNLDAWFAGLDALRERLEGD